jgi:hypothetical protein
MQTKENQNLQTTKITFTKTSPSEWLLAFWKEIDDKTFGQGFDCFVEDATCRLGVAEWTGREVIRESLRAFIDTGFTALHDVTEYWDGGIQLGMAYAPEPPFQSGTPDSAPPYVLAEAQHLGEMLTARRLETARRVATRLGINEAPGK